MAEYLCDGCGEYKKTEEFRFNWNVSCNICKQCIKRMIEEQRKKLLEMNTSEMTKEEKELYEAVKEMVFSEEVLKW